MIVNTPTIEDYTTVVKWAISKGIPWNNNSTEVLEKQWYKCKTKTCVNINITTKCLYYGHKDDYIQKGRDVLHIKYFIENFLTTYKEILKDFI